MVIELVIVVRKGKGTKKFGIVPPVVHLIKQNSVVRGHARARRNAGAHRALVAPVLRAIVDRYTVSHGFKSELCHHRGH